MNKKTFIPRDFRPKIKGIQLQKNESSSDFIYNSTRCKQSIVCLYVRGDETQTRALQKSLHSISEEVIFLCYDDLGKTWHFSFSDNQLIFLLDNESIEPIGIYSRPYHPEQSDPDKEIFIHLHQALELWNGSFIGAKLDNFHNASKIFQLASTIHTAIQLSGCSSLVSAPSSFFIKGDSQQLDKLIEEKGALIVKSCSGTRSKVVCDKTFSLWSKDSLYHLPSLFQVRADGVDIRVHVLDNACWAVSVPSKDEVDYRYADNVSDYEIFDLPEQLIHFCYTLSQVEKNRLIGVDFIRSDNDFVCLESNPSPGWASFILNDKNRVDISKTIIKSLISHEKPSSVHESF